jgi:hypothetical protein
MPFYGATGRCQRPPGSLRTLPAPNPFRSVQFRKLWNGATVTATSFWPTGLALGWRRLGLAMGGQAPGGVILLLGAAGQLRAVQQAIPSTSLCIQRTISAPHGKAWTGSDPGARAHIRFLCTIMAKIYAATMMPEHHARATHIALPGGLPESRARMASTMEVTG